MKKLVPLLLAFCTAIAAEEKPYFGYSNFHTVDGTPMLGIGIRAQRGMHAFDLSGNLDTWHGVAPRVVSLRGLYLLYPHQAAGPYCGAGLGIMASQLQTTVKKIDPSLQAVVGYQWNSLSRHPLFLELNLSTLFRTLDQTIPDVTFGFGF